MKVTIRKYAIGYTISFAFLPIKNFCAGEGKVLSLGIFPGCMPMRKSSRALINSAGSTRLFPSLSRWFKIAVTCFGDSFSPAIFSIPFCNSGASIKWSSLVSISPNASAAVIPESAIANAKLSKAIATAPSSIPSSTGSSSTSAAESSS